MKNKGAMNWEQLVKLVFGVLCLIIIIWAIVKVYNWDFGGSELAKAKSTLKELEYGLNEARAGGKPEIMVFTPNDWWIIAWPYQQRTEKPKKDCEKNCFCICKVPSISQNLKGLDALAELCDKTGACVNLDEKVKTMRLGLLWGTNNAPIVIEEPPVNLEITYNESSGFVVEEQKK